MVVLPILGDDMQGVVVDAQPEDQDREIRRLGRGEVPFSKRYYQTFEWYWLHETDEHVGLTCIIWFKVLPVALFPARLNPLISIQPFVQTLVSDMGGEPWGCVRCLVDYTLALKPHRQNGSDKSGEYYTAISCTATPSVTS
jgi:hypothetical protein